MKVHVFIATSLDGYIADKEGGIDWLHGIPNPENEDMGYSTFISKMDAILMGRNTFEKVLSFGIEWPYSCPVYILSTSLKSVPNNLAGQVKLLPKNLQESIKTLKNIGIKNLYVDGGRTIQSFLEKDLIDEMTLTTIPILLGGGKSLFGDLINPLEFTCVKSSMYLNAVVQSTFVRNRN